MWLYNFFISCCWQDIWPMVITRKWAVARTSSASQTMSHMGHTPVGGKARASMVPSTIHLPKDLRTILTKISHYAPCVTLNPVDLKSWSLQQTCAQWDGRPSIAAIWCPLITSIITPVSSCVLMKQLKKEGKPGLTEQCCMQQQAFAIPYLASHSLMAISWHALSVQNSTLANIEEIIWPYTDDCIT